MSTKLILSSLFPDAPYFEGVTQGFQGFPLGAIRHAFMMGTIHKVAQSVQKLKMLEIGSWTGSSALTWSEGIAKYCSGGGSILCVDPWTPYLDNEDIQKTVVYQNMNYISALDLSYYLFLHNIKFAATGVEINHFRGTGSEVLPYLERASFDLIYLDGSHYLEDVRFDIAQAVKLLKDGGILCGDDLELKGDECDLEFAKAHPVADFIKDPKTGKNFHPGVTVAVHERFPEVSSYSGYWLMQKINDTYQPVDLDTSSLIVPSHFPKEIQDNVKEELKAISG